VSRPMTADRADLKVICVIPARFASTRMPGKPLALINDVPMVEWVARGASESEYVDELIVATDDERIRDAVESFGRAAIMTSEDLQSGTDRVAIAAAGCECDLVVNIQGDEPQIKGPMIDAVVEALLGDQTVPMATLAHAMSEEEASDPNSVKVVCDLRGRALYFSRSPVPYVMEVEKADWLEHHRFYKHVGVYAYKMHVLRKITELPVSSLEATERLEQNRWLENGYRIKVEITDHESIPVDTPEDLERIQSLLGKNLLSSPGGTAKK